MVCEAVGASPDHSWGQSPQIQILLEEMKPLESLHQGKPQIWAANHGGARAGGRAGPDAVMLQPVTYDNEWEMLSPQNIIPGNGNGGGDRVS